VAGSIGCENLGHARGKSAIAAVRSIAISVARVYSKNNGAYKQIRQNAQLTVPAPTVSVTIDRKSAGSPESGGGAIEPA
jgi:hypothetical protein